MEELAIEVRGLRKTYDDFVAVDGIDFEVRRGEIFGLLGPNGAGKTTTLECLEGLRDADEGEMLVGGVDPGSNRKKLYRGIGVQLQSGSLPGYMTVREALRLFGAHRGVTPDPGIPARLGLAEHMDTQYAALSTGQKRRTDLALAILHRPGVLFLDEPTAGLDVSTRIALHGIIEELRESGTTVILSTHDMAEAEELADRVAILIRGRIAAIGSPRDLTATGHGMTRISARTTGASLGCGAFADFRPEGEYFVGFTTTPGPAVMRIMDHISRAGDTLVDLRVERPSLEERFLEMVRDESA